MEDDIGQIIDDHGWAVIKVDGSDEEPNYAYSLGLFKNFSHPEVIVFGLAPDVLHQIVNVIGEEVRKGGRFSAPSVSTDVLEGYACAFRQVAPGAVHHYMNGGLTFYGHEFPAVHCIWPNRAGHFPWDAEADDSYRRLQPMLSDGPEPHTGIRP